MPRKLNPMGSLTRAAINGIVSSIRSAKTSKPNKQKQKMKQSGNVTRKVSAPAAQTIILQQSKPRINRASNKNGTILEVAHRELIDGSIPAATSWTNQVNLRINPASSDAFPWLSTLANSFEFYRFKKLRFIYIPRCATSSTGSVQMAPDYDASDSPPSSELIFGSYAQYVDGVIWSELTCPIDVSAKTTSNAWKYVLANPNENQLSQINNFDLGNFFMYTSDSANTNPCGKLYVEYVVEFRQPTMPSAGSITNAVLYMSGGGSLTGINPFGDNPTLTYVNGIGEGQDSSGHGIVKFYETGVFLVSYTIGGTVLTGASPAFNGGSGTIDNSNIIVNTAATGMVAYLVVTVTALSEAYRFAYLDFGASSQGTTVTASSLCASKISN